MQNIKFRFMINGTEWKEPHLQRMEYERNLHMIHSLKEHGIEVKDGDKILSDDDIDYLTMEKIWDVSVENRAHLSGEEISRYYKESFKISEQYWKERPFSQNLPMRRSYCHMYVDGIDLKKYMNIVNDMMHDARLILRIHPEHMNAIETPQRIIGIEPFGTYGVPTFCIVKRTDLSEMGPQIQKDSDPAFPLKSAGKAYLLDGVTEINSPFHQYRTTDSGLEAKLSVYWPDKVPDEIVDGHSLHLAMEFYESLVYADKILTES